MLFRSATRSAVEVERAFLAELGTGCSLPVGGHVSGGRLIGFLADPHRAGDGAGLWWVRESVALCGETASDLASARSLARDLQGRIGVDGRPGSSAT